MKTSKCPLCLKNGQIDLLIAETGDAYLTVRRDKDGEITPECYLIVPKVHFRTIEELPDLWWASVKTLLKAVPGKRAHTHFNINGNEGKRAGRSVKGHCHLWVIVRPKDEGEASSGIGLKGLIDKTQEQAKCISQLRQSLYHKSNRPARIF